MKKRGMIQCFVLVAGVILAGIYYYNTNTVTKQQASWETMEETVTQTEQLSKAASTPSVIYVHVCGAVNNPGVYEGEAGLRLYQFIELAGGFREDASVECLNLAQGVQDGTQIYVPSKTEEASAVVVPSLTESGSQKLNLNIASKNELMELPGIGNAKAEAILSYRDTNGLFQSVEELMNVPGIKEATFEQIKNLITVQ